MSSNREQILVDALNEVAAGQQGELKASFIHRIMKVASNALASYNALEQEDSSGEQKLAIELLAIYKVIIAYGITTIRPKKIIDERIEALKSIIKNGLESTPDDVRDERKEVEIDLWKLAKDYLVLPSHWQFKAWKQIGYPETMDWVNESNSEANRKFFTWVKDNKKQKELFDVINQIQH